MIPFPRLFREEKLDAEDEGLSADIDDALEFLDLCEQDGSFRNSHADAISTARANWAMRGLRRDLSPTQLTLVREIAERFIRLPKTRDDVQDGEDTVRQNVQRMTYGYRRQKR